MSKVACNVVMDLLPLYIDQVCSREANNLVEEHLNECENCKCMLEKLKDTTKINFEDIKKEKEILTGIANKWNRRKGTSFLKGALLAFMFCICIIGLYYGFFVYQGTMISPKNVFAETEENNEKLIIKLQVEDGYEGCGIDTEVIDNSLYIQMYRTKIAQKENDFGKEIVTYGVDLTNKNYNAIYYGIADENKLIWQR